ncbi:MAG: hypothetical protein RL685_2954 [Pseudomonadota bacterium]
MRQRGRASEWRRWPGPPSPANWSFETGFVRNEEAQWYQAGNASVRSGFLIIEGRRERLPNPNYRAGPVRYEADFVRVYRALGN